MLTGEKKTDVAVIASLLPHGVWFITEEQLETYPGIADVLVGTLPDRRRPRRHASGFLRYHP